MNIPHNNSEYYFVTHPRFLDSNNFSIGIHSFKVLVQIHYSRSPFEPLNILFVIIINIAPLLMWFRSLLLILVILLHKKGDLRASLVPFYLEKVHKWSGNAVGKILQ